MSFAISSWSEIAYHDPSLTQYQFKIAEDLIYDIANDTFAGRLHHFSSPPAVPHNVHACHSISNGYFWPCISGAVTHDKGAWVTSWVRLRLFLEPRPKQRCIQRWHTSTICEPCLHVSCMLGS